MTGGLKSPFLSSKELVLKISLRNTQSMPSQVLPFPFRFWPRSQIYWYIPIMQCYHINPLWNTSSYTHQTVIGKIHKNKYMNIYINKKQWNDDLNTLFKLRSVIHSGSFYMVYTQPVYIQVYTHLVHTDLYTQYLFQETRNIL